MEWLNYNHLYYFWVIAKEGSIVKACKKLRLAQSTLSSQLKTFESVLGHQLFDRRNRALELTEAGRQVLYYAESIFSTGLELLDVLKNRTSEKSKTVVRLGCINSISKKLQYELVSPAFGMKNYYLSMIEGSLSQMIRLLEAHSLDIIVSNIPVRTDKSKGIFNHPIGEIDVWLVGHPKFEYLKKKFPAPLNDAPFFLPTHQSKTRADIEFFFQENRIMPRVMGEIEDLALLKIFALKGHGLCVAPRVGVEEEIQKGNLIVIDKLPKITETLWAITASRKMPNPLIEEMIKSFSGKYVMSKP